MASDRTGQNYPLRLNTVITGSTKDLVPAISKRIDVWSNDLTSRLGYLIGDGVKSLEQLYNTELHKELLAADANNISNIQANLSGNISTIEGDITQLQTDLSNIDTSRDTAAEIKTKLETEFVSGSEKIDPRILYGYPFTVVGGGSGGSLGLLILNISATVYNEQTGGVIRVDDTSQDITITLADTDADTDETAITPGTFALAVQNRSGNTVFINTLSTPISQNDIDTIELPPNGDGFIFGNSTGELVFEGDFELRQAMPLRKIVLDNGRSDNQSSGNINNFTSFADGQISSLVEYVTGISSGINVHLPVGQNVQAALNNSDGLNIAVNVPEIGQLPSSVAADNCFSSGAGAGIFRSFVFEELDNSKDWDVYFLSSRSATGNRVGLFRVNGGTQIEVDAAANNTISSFLGVAPVNGKIAFEFAAKTADDAAYVNFIAMVEKARA